MLASLREAHPALVLEVSLSNAAADLLEQEVDVAVRMHPPRHGALIAKKVGAIAIGLFAHRDYLARRGVPQTLDDLSEHDVIGSDRAQADLALAETLDPRMVRDRSVLRTDSHPAQLALARAGFGIAIAQCAAASADTNLQAVLPELIIPALDTWIVMHEDLRRVPRVRTVFDHLVTCFTCYAASR